MYKISVPMICTNIKRAGGCERLEAELRKIGAQRIFLALGLLKTDPVERKKDMDTLAENCKYFKERGFEVGAWMWTFWCDGGNFAQMLGADRHENTGFCCPLDENFKRFSGEYIQQVAKCGVDMIMFDDDFRFGFFGGNGIYCTCEHHMRKIRKIVGEDITREKLQELAISGGANKYRDAWMKANGDSLKAFAANAREYLDKVRPEVRMGACSCMTLWDNDGVDAITITKILAGNTKPFMRLIGAPYWAVNKSWGNRLEHIIELERMESAWCKNARSEGVEVFSEGDAYPRPRTNCPSSYLEIFDMALRADGTNDGILKYAIDYRSSLDYETGYVERHCRNKPVYDAIERIFNNKNACGVRVYEAMNKLRDMKIPEKICNSGKVENIFFSPASRMLSSLSVPTTYDGDGTAAIAFGENIKYVPESAFLGGIIIDMRAAEILAEKGIDTGICEIVGKKKSTEEFFCRYNEYVQVGSDAEVFEVKLKDGADVLSRFVVSGSDYGGGNDTVPASFIYTNNKGHKFLVFNFEAYFNSESLIRSYARSRQICDAVKTLSGKALPAYCYGNPDLYIISKKDDSANKMAVGMWNIFADSVLNPVVELDGEYSEAEFINCTGKIDGNKVILSEIAPFGFAGFDVKKLV